MTTLVSDVRFQNSLYNWSSETRNVGTPFYFYGNYQLSDRLSFGLAVYTPYGSKVDWDQDWAGSHLVNNIEDRKSTRLNSSHVRISYAVFCLKKKNINNN